MAMHCQSKVLNNICFTEKGGLVPPFSYVKFYLVEIYFI